ncbi:LysR family transcriptional regulator [Actinoplanes sp. CA-131856]
MARHADLNMLTALDALLTECSVTRAAERLQISQPAMSSALARLRRHFGDDLLIRAGQSYQLTPLAARLAEPTAQVVAAADQVLSAQPDFDPARSRRTFTVIMSDYALTVLGAAVATLIDQRAPRVQLQGRRAFTDEREARLSSFRWLHRYNTVRRHSRLGQQSPISYENSLRPAPATLAPAA